jgi:hypothetical protein
MPSAIPNSPPVSCIDAAEPAFSAGAAARIMPIVSAIGSEMPNEARVSPVTNSPSPPTLSTCVWRSRPTPARASPPAQTYAARTR